MSRRQWLNRRWPALVLLGIIVAYALLVPALHPQVVHALDLQDVYLAPGPGHWFGTDQLGRDVWVRAAQALRLSLLLAACSALASTVLGVLAGVAAAAAGGLADRVIMRLIDTVNSIPHLLLGVVVLALWPGNGWAIVASIALTHWTQVARVVRAKLVAERESGWVRLSRAAGARPAMIWCTHLIPAVAPQAGIALVLQLPHAIWHESALSFLGVGLPPEAASLGLLLEDARGGILVGAWWLLVFPALLLVATSWALASFTHPSSRRRPAARRIRRPAARRVRPAEGARLPASSTGRVLEVRNLRVWDTGVDGQPVTLLHGIDYRAEPGAVNVIMGDSGAGKTLLLRALSGLLPAQLDADGEVMLDDRVLDRRGLDAARGRDLVFIPGSAATALHPVRTVGRALATAHRRHGRPSDRLAGEAALRAVGLGPELLGRYPHELSGGQAQRVALALGLVPGAGCVLLDEPTSALDARSAAGIARVLRALAAAGHTVVVVTHDHRFAAEHADHLTVLSGGRRTGTALTPSPLEESRMEGSAP